MTSKALPKPVTPTKRAELLKMDGSQMNALLARIDKGKPRPDDLDTLQALFEEIPGVHQALASLVLINERALLEKLTNRPTTQLGIRVNCNQLRRDLGYEASPMLEQLIIDEIVACWLYLQWTRYQLTGDGGSLVSFWEKRVSAAQQRFLRASESLGKVRKLNISLQVNIATNGGQQVNVQG